MTPASDELKRALLSPQEAAAMNAHGGTDAAVLLPLYGWPERPGLVFTERRADLRRHAGEISFPGGTRDHPDEDLVDTALREAEEEIGLDPITVEIAGALPPVGTFATGYKVHPYVGLIAGGPRFEPNPAEVESVLLFGLDALRAGHGRRRVTRSRMPFKHDTYLVEGNLIWGATARILGLFLDRLER